MDDHVVCCGIIGSCQSAATSEIVKHFWTQVLTHKKRYSKYLYLYFCLSICLSVCLSVCVCLCVFSLSGGVHQHRGGVLLHAWLEVQHGTLSSVQWVARRGSGIRQEDWRADGSPWLALLYFLVFIVQTWAWSVCDCWLSSVRQIVTFDVSLRSTLWCCLLAVWKAGFPCILKSPWIFFLYIQGLESTWKQGQCLKVLESEFLGSWKSGIFLAWLPLCWHTVCYVVCKLICWQYFNVVSTWLHAILQSEICHVMCNDMK